MNKVDIILKNAIVITMDSEFHQFEPGAVAITGNTIQAIGEESEILRSYEGVQEVDCGGKVLMPGLVNAHTHAPMTLLRGLADDLRLDVWLMGYMMPVEREFVSLDFIRLGTQLACAEMIKSGITSFADMYYFEPRRKSECALFVHKPFSNSPHRTRSFTKSLWKCHVTLSSVGRGIISSSLQ
jgi:5-methylthioadenosine/S-adenosylhomocysteine deaminase